MRRRDRWPRETSVQGPVPRWDRFSERRGARKEDSGAARLASARGPSAPPPLRIASATSTIRSRTARSAAPPGKTDLDIGGWSMSPKKTPSFEKRDLGGHLEAAE